MGPALLTALSAVMEGTALMVIVVSQRIARSVDSVGNGAWSRAYSSVLVSLRAKVGRSWFLASGVDIVSVQVD